MADMTLQGKLLHLHDIVKKMRKYQIAAKEIRSGYDKSMAIRYAELVDKASSEIDKMLNIYDLDEKTSDGQKTFWDDNISDPPRGTEILSPDPAPPRPPLENKKPMF